MPYDGQAVLEKFLNREPLNDELAAIREGKISLVETPVEPVAAPRVGVIEEPNRELTRPERLELRELRQSEGWPLLMRLLLKRFLALEKAAITVSKSNPLANAEGIAQKWHYVGVYKQVASDMELLLEEELAKLKEEEQ